MNSIKKNLMIEAYDAPSMPIETLQALHEADVIVCEGVDDYLETMEELFVNEEAYGYDQFNDYSRDFDLEDAHCYCVFNDYIKTINTGVLKCEDKVYWIIGEIKE